MTKLGKANYLTFGILILLAPIAISVDGKLLFILRILNLQWDYTVADPPAIYPSILIALLPPLLFPTTVRLAAKRTPRFFIFSALTCLYILISGLIGWMNYGTVRSAMYAIQTSCSIVSVVSGTILGAAVVFEPRFWRQALAVFLVPTYLIVGTLVLRGVHDPLALYSKTRQAMPHFSTHIPAVIIFLFAMYIYFQAKRRVGMVEVLISTAVASLSVICWSRAVVAFYALQVFWLLVFTGLSSTERSRKLKVVLLLMLFSTLTAAGLLHGLIATRLEDKQLESVEGLVAGQADSDSVDVASESMPASPTAETSSVELTDSVEPTEESPPVTGPAERAPTEDASTEDASAEHAAKTEPRAAKDKGIVGSATQSNQSRREYLKQGLLLWLENPMLGNQFEIISLTHGDLARERVFPAHNQYLDILVKLGIVGLVLFCACGISLFFELVLPVLRLGGESRLDALFIMASVVSVLILSTLQLFITVLTSGVVFLFFSAAKLASLPVDHGTK